MSAFDFQPPYRLDGPRPAGSWCVTIAANGNTWIEGPRIGGNGVFPNEGIVSLSDGCCTEADATLIAAGPDLAFALKLFHDEITSRFGADSDMGPELRAVVDTARFALAKAGLGATLMSQSPQGERRVISALRARGLASSPQGSAPESPAPICQTEGCTHFVESSENYCTDCLDAKALYQVVLS